MACGKRPANPNLLDMAKTSPLQTLVICPDTKDPENLGAIIRLCAAFGVQGLILGPACADHYSRRVLRVSMGTVFQLPVQVSYDIPGMLSTLTADGFELAATLLSPTAKPLIHVKRPQKLGLLFGSEGFGLTPEIAGLCRTHLTIPMAPGVDSLNVAVATGIFLHYFQHLAMPVESP